MSSQTDDPAQRIDPFPARADVEETMQDLRQLLENLSGARIVEARSDYLRAEVSSRLMRFVDDVEFLLDPEARVVHVRSASRVGHWDIGINRKRVEQLRKAYLK